MQEQGKKETLDFCFQNPLYAFPGMEETRKSPWSICGNVRGYNFAKTNDINTFYLRLNLCLVRVCIDL